MRKEGILGSRGNLVAARTGDPAPVPAQVPARACGKHLAACRSARGARGPPRVPWLHPAAHDHGAL